MPLNDLNDKIFHILTKAEQANMGAREVFQDAREEFKHLEGSRKGPRTCSSRWACAVGIEVVHCTQQHLKGPIHPRTWGMSLPPEQTQMHTFTPSLAHEQLHPVPVTLISAEISSLTVHPCRRPNCYLQSDSSPHLTGCRG